MRALTLVVVLALAGCSSLNPANWGSYHMDVQQGNLVTQDAVAQLKLGMSRSQVRFLLGSPLLSDPFHTDRWDYKYQMFKNDIRVDDKLLTLTFKDDKLAKIEGDAMPPEIPVVPLDEPHSAASAPAASAPAVAVPASAQQGAVKP